MTAQDVPAKADKLIPRPLIRSFWLIHRMLVRVSGGRVGLRTPEAGKTFLLDIEVNGRFEHNVLL